METLQAIMQRLFHQKVSSPPFPHVFLPENVAEATARMVASFSHFREQHEGVSYWAGIPSSNGLVITSVIVPEAKTTRESFQTSVSANAWVIKIINDHHLQLLAQVHGHPSSRVDHSDEDEKKAFMPYEGFYSIVLPWYGRKGMVPLDTCGIYRFERGIFRKLLPAEIGNTFTVLPVAIELRSKNGLTANS